MKGNIEKKPVLKHLSDKARTVEKALRTRFAGQLKDDEIDLVFVHYVYGFLDASHPDAEPDDQISTLRSIAEENLAPSAVTAALHGVPNASRPGLLRVATSVEAIGQRDAQAFQSTQQSIHDSGVV